MNKEREVYQSYMLRLWCAEETNSIWRASLEDPRTGERQTFPNQEALFAHLLEVTGRSASYEQ